MTTITATKMRLTSMQAGRIPCDDLPITTSEVFSWVCAKQGVDPKRLNETRYRSLWTIADRAMDAINRLYAEKADAQNFTPSAMTELVSGM